jgi:hypothetical protein
MHCSIATMLPRTFGRIKPGNAHDERRPSLGATLSCCPMEHSAKRPQLGIAKRLHAFLREVWEDDTEGKRLVIQSILDNLQVFPVSAPQYRLHCSQESDDDKPFLPDAEATNILALRTAISQVAHHCMAEQNHRREQTHQRFFGQLRARLEVLSAQRSEERQADEEINGFKQNLDGFMPPLQRQFDTRRGDFRSKCQFPLLTLLDAPDFARLATGNPKSGRALPPGSGGSRGDAGRHRFPSP